MKLGPPPRRLKFAGGAPTTSLFILIGSSGVPTIAVSAL